MSALKAGKTTATYSGMFVGAEGEQNVSKLKDDGSNGLLALTGWVAMTADFGTGKVTGNIYDIERTDGINYQWTDYGISMSGKMDGSMYSGTAALTDVYGNPLSGTAAGKGDMIGGFYGEDAAETAGAVRVTNVAGDLGCDVASASCGVVGAFGAGKDSLPTK